MRDAFDRFIYRHWPRSFLLVALGLVVAYGMWWIATDVWVRTYPQHVANTIQAPPRVEFVGSETVYSRKCKLSVIEKYFSSNEPWSTIADYYRDKLRQSWESMGDVQYYQQSGEYGKLSFTLHRIELTPEGKPSDPSKKQIVFNGSTAYLIQIAYNQDLRVFDNGGACEPKD